MSNSATRLATRAPNPPTSETSWYSTYPVPTVSLFASVVARQPSPNIHSSSACAGFQQLSFVLQQHSPSTSSTSSQSFRIRASATIMTFIIPFSGVRMLLIWNPELYVSHLVHGLPLTGIQKRYNEITFAIRVWSHLQGLKRRGAVHRAENVESLPKGSMAVRCYACPQPGKNVARSSGSLSYE